MRISSLSVARWFEWLVGTAALFLLAGGLDWALHSPAVPQMNPPLARAILVPFFAAATVLLWRRADAALAAVAATWPVLLLLALAAVSVLWSTDRLVSASWTAGLAGTTAVGIFLAVRFDAEERLQIVCLALGIAALASVAVLIFGAEVGARPARGVVWRGIFEDNNLFGRAMALAALAFLVLAVEQPKRRLSGALGLVAAAVLVRGSSSLTAMLGAVAGFVATAAAALLRQRSASVRRLAVSFGALALVLGVATAVTERAQVAVRLGRSPSLSGRTLVWDQTWTMARQRLWLGHGYGTYWPRAQAAVVETSPLRERWPVRHPHDGYLEILFELGLLGLLVFLVSFVLLFRRALGHAVAPEGSLWPLAYLVFLALINVSESDLLRHKIFWALYVAVAVDLFGADKGRGDAPHRRAARRSALQEL